MLQQPRIAAFIPTVKPAASKHFYTNVLGLTLMSEDDYSIELSGGGVSLRITIVQEFIPHPFAVLGFKIDKIESQVKSLLIKGVKFEIYNSLLQDDMGIWTAPSKAKIAWFRDPDENLLSMTEYAPL